MTDIADAAHSAAEMMAVAAARLLRNDDVCFVGIGAPSLACNLARLTHAPDITLIYESGTVGARPDVLPLSIGDPELCETARTTVSVPEMFAYWLQGGRRVFHIVAYITRGFSGSNARSMAPTSGPLSSTLVQFVPPLLLEETPPSVPIQTRVGAGPPPQCELGLK